MKHHALLFIFILGTSLVACDKDDDDDNNSNNNNNNTPTDEISLDNLNDGEAAIEAMGDTAFAWTDTCYYEYWTTLQSSGTLYDEWKVTMPGPNPGDELVIDILQVDTTATGSQDVIPADGTYTIGGSMDENDVSVSIGSDFYSFRTTSAGSLTLTKNGEVWNIELNAEDLESGGIGEEDKFISINAALKAVPE